MQHAAQTLHPPNFQQGDYTHRRIAIQEGELKVDWNPTQNPTQQICFYSVCLFCLIEQEIEKANLFLKAAQTCVLLAASWNRST